MWTGTLAGDPSEPWRPKMTRTEETRVAVPLVMLMLSHPVFGQNTLDLKEADARNAAYEIISAAKERFDCKLEEHAMQGVGNEPDMRYVFHVTAEGGDCREALVFATNMAARDDKIMFRTVQVEDSTHRPGDRLIFDTQTLIHEINPGTDDENPPEE